MENLLEPLYENVTIAIKQATQYAELYQKLLSDKTDLSGYEKPLSKEKIKELFSLQSSLYIRKLKLKSNNLKLKSNFDLWKEKHFMITEKGCFIFKTALLQFDERDCTIFTANEVYIKFKKE
jgi:hypothetical protein